MCGAWGDGGVVGELAAFLLPAGCGRSGRGVQLVDGVRVGTEEHDYVTLTVLRIFTDFA